jgi:hypothetical protein
LTSPALTFGWEPLAQLLADGVADISREHWEEIALDKASVPLDVDWGRYLDYEAAGIWRAFAARDGGKLIGYVAWWFEPNPRYRSTTYCTADVFFIRPEHRKGSLGLRLFRETFAALPRPCKVLINEKLGFKDGRVGKIFEHMGFRPIEVVYSKFLPREGD